MRATEMCGKIFCEIWVVFTMWHFGWRPVVVLSTTTSFFPILFFPCLCFTGAMASFLCFNLFYCLLRYVFLFVFFLQVFLVVLQFIENFR